MSEWSKVRLGDLISIKHGFPFKSDLFSEELTGKPIVVNIGNFNYTGGFRFEQTTLKEYRGSYPKEYELKADDILLVMTCQTPGGEILGIPATIPDDQNVYLHNQRLGKVIVLNEEIVDQRFLYWLFLSPEFNRHLVVTASGTKILHTSPTRIESFQFNLPPIAEQKRIAEILGALDDKIELNRRMNRTLEAMARALFQSWFVDFDPVHAKARGETPYGMDDATAALFPDSFEETALGLVPRGWKVATMRDSCKRIENGGTPKRDNPAYWNPPEVPWLTSGEVRQRIVMQTENFISKSGLKNSSAKLWQPFTSVVAMYGATAGEVTFLATEMCTNQACCGLIPEDDFRFFNYFYLLSQTQNLASLSRGSAQQNLSQQIIANFRVIIPTLEILQIFDESLEASVATMISNLQQALTLTALKDTLLPKLVGGQINLDTLFRMELNVSRN